MVKKLLIKINNNAVATQNVSDLLDHNKIVMQTATKYKNKITKFHDNKSWDKYKKLSNEYEPIFTSPHSNNTTNISNYIPVSRSFFKLWEILHDFADFFNLKGGAKCLFLAEGPGGFAEALIKYRNCIKDEYIGMTLKSFNDKNIPDWKLNKEVMKRVKVTFGADNTGNLYNIDNTLHIGFHQGLNSFDYITADGGFDFSADFNNQEELSTHLIFSEIFAAITLQKEGGVFILKIFDMFNDQTLKLMHLLKRFYKDMYIIKPLTSRPANSEKYVVCTGFSFDKTTWERMRDIMVNYDYEYLKEIEWNVDLLQQLVSFNVHYIIKQVFYIERTIQYINKFESSNDQSELHEIIKKHNEKSKKWCIKYKIPSCAII